VTAFGIRRAGDNQRDVALVAELFDAYRQFYECASDPSLARRFIQERLEKGESVVFLATSVEGEAERGLGFVQLYPSFSSVSAARIMVLNDLFVHPEARRAGVGRALMEQARRHAIGAGAVRLTLETAAPNRQAQRLYESLGYRCENDEVRFYTLELGDGE
jgi:ribosomal protein S18 acetylase RimI-like enzyme